MQKNAFYIMLMLMVGASYGLVAPILRLGYGHDFSAADMTNAQYGLAFVVLWLIVLVPRVRHFGRKLASGRKNSSHSTTLATTQRACITKRQWLLLFAIGASAAAVSYCYYMALTVLPASVGIVLLFQFSWMTTVIDIIVKRTLPGVGKWIGLVFIILGTLFAVDSSSLHLHGIPIWALVLGLAAALFYALVLYLSSYADVSIPSTLRSAIIVTVGMLLMFIPFHPTYLTSGVLLHGLAFWGGLIALFGQVLPLLLMLIAIPKIGGRMAGILGTIELPVSVFAAWLLDKDLVGWIRWSGVALIVVGIVVSELRFGNLRQRTLKNGRMVE